MVRFMHALSLGVLMSGFRSGSGVGKPLMRNQESWQQQADSADDALAEVLLESPGLLAEGSDFDLDDDAVGLGIAPRLGQTPAEEAEEKGPHSEFRSALQQEREHMNVNAKVADDWLHKIMTEGLHPASDRASAARDMDEWAKDTRMTYGDELMPKHRTQRPRPAAPEPKAVVDDTPDQQRLTGGPRQRQHEFLEEHERGNPKAKSAEVLPEESCFKEWSEWGPCSATCWNGGAWQKKSRARLPEAASAVACSSWSMEKLRVCNRFVGCPITNAANAADGSGDEALGCGVGEPVACPVLADYPVLDTKECHGNMCCHHRGQGGDTVSSVCPSAEGGWGDNKCNFAKQQDCTGGISGYRVSIERHDVVHPNVAIGREDPIKLPESVPDIQAFRHVAEGEVIAAPTGRDQRAIHISTCSTHVCTEGWRAKLGLPDNSPCESSPCTEVECCVLMRSEQVSVSQAPCATSPPEEIPERVVKVAQEMSPATAIALDTIVACVGLIFCIVGFYLGRRWTQFQEWYYAEPEEAEEGQEKKDEASSAAAHGEHH